MGRTHQQGMYFVVKSLKSDLLGFPAISSLKLIRSVFATQSDEESHAIKHKFPNVFKGLVNLGDEYVIKLKGGSQPYSLFTPRNIPIPLRPKVKTELDCMCAGIVVVPKHSGAVRICFDLKPLNESVLREVHPIPTVDDTLAQLSGASVFIKLDANSGFWQIPLAKSLYFLLLLLHHLVDIVLVNFLLAYQVLQSCFNGG